MNVGDTNIFDSRHIVLLVPFLFYDLNTCHWALFALSATGEVFWSQHIGQCSGI